MSKRYEAHDCIRNVSDGRPHDILLENPCTNYFNALEECQSITRFCVNTEFLQRAAVKVALFLPKQRKPFHRFHFHN